MTEWTDQITMMMRAARKKYVITADLAVKIADLIFRKEFSDATADNQMPWIVNDMGDKWEVIGSTDRPSSPDFEDPIGGRLRIVLMKADCQIKALERDIISG